MFFLILCFVVLIAISMFGPKNFPSGGGGSGGTCQGYDQLIDFQVIVNGGETINAAIQFNSINGLATMALETATGPLESTFTYYYVDQTAYDERAVFDIPLDSNGEYTAIFCNCSGYTLIPRLIGGGPTSGQIDLVTGPDLYNQTIDFRDNGNNDLSNGHWSFFHGSSNEKNVVFYKLIQEDPGNGLLD